MKIIINSIKDYQETPSYHSELTLRIKMVRRITKITQLSSRGSSTPIPKPAVSPCFLSALVSIWISFRPIFIVPRVLFFFFRLWHHICFRFPNLFLSVLFPIFLDFSVPQAHKSSTFQPLPYVESVSPFKRASIEPKTLPSFADPPPKSASGLPVPPL